MEIKPEPKITPDREIKEVPKNKTSEFIAYYSFLYFFHQFKWKIQFSFIYNVVIYCKQIYYKRFTYYYQNKIFTKWQTN